MKKFVLNCNALLSPWTEGQKLLPQIVRWKKYADANPLLRKQSTLTHLWGIQFAGSVILSEIKPFPLVERFFLGQNK